MAYKTEYNIKLDNLLSELHISLFKKNSFKKSGRYFYKYEKPFWSIIDFQSSQWNSKLEGNFTINIGLHDERYDSLQRKTFPKSYECKPFYAIRIGALINNNDHWFEISEETDLTKLFMELSELIKNKIFPSFNEWGKIPEVKWVSTVYTN